MVLSLFGSIKIIFCLFVCFLIDYLNGVFKYNEICFIEIGRDSGIVAFCLLVFEFIGGNLFREVWIGGEDRRFMSVCL